MKIDSTTTTKDTKPFDEELMIRNKVIDWNKILAPIIPDSKDISKEINLKHIKQITEILKNAKAEIDDKGRIYYCVNLENFKLSLEEKINLQDKGYGIFIRPSNEQEYMSQFREKQQFVMWKPEQTFIMWMPKKEG